MINISYTSIRSFFLIACTFAMATTLYSQNVGINNANPRSPLSFSTALGQKLSFWDDGGVSGNNYGMGIQSGLLQVHTDLSVSNIAFGFGKSTGFTERMRIINSGDNGLSLNGRIVLKNGTSPLDVNYGTGLWLYKADNTNLLGFMGVQNNQNLGFYGGPAGWGFVYDAINSRVGIGTSTPNAPLGFPPVLGKKITFYPGATGDAGIGVSGNRLYLYSDNPNADVAFGFDAAGVFNEKFSIKPNGALALSGNIGAAGQLLKSNGNASAIWSNNPATEMYNNTTETLATNYVDIPEQQIMDIPGMTKTISLSKTSKVMVQFMIPSYTIPCTFCGNTNIDMMIYVDGNMTGYIRHVYPNAQYGTMSGNRIFTLNPGNHDIKIVGFCLTGPTIRVGSSPSVYSSYLNIMVIPQE